MIIIPILLIAICINIKYGFRIEHGDFIETPNIPGIKGYHDNYLVIYEK